MVSSFLDGYTSVAKAVNDVVLFVMEKTISSLSTSSIYRNLLPAFRNSSLNEVISSWGCNLLGGTVFGVYLSLMILTSDPKAFTMLDFPEAFAPYMARHGMVRASPSSMNGSNSICLYPFGAFFSAYVMGT